MMDKNIMDYYRKINNSMYTNSRREIDLLYVKKQISSDFKNISFSIVINGHYTQALIMDISDKNSKKIISRPDEVFKAGDHIVWMENDWLITEMDDNQEIYCRGKMSKCPSSLKWQDQYGYIHETWFAYISDTMSNSGIKEDRVMKLDNERRNIIFQNNDHTISFDKEKRFIFDRRTWKITDIDRLDPHLITAVLEVTPTDSVKDNTSLRVADYVNPNYEITVDKISVLLKPSESYQLHTEVKNNGITLINPILSFSSSDQSICTVDNDGLISSVSEGSVVITVNYKESYKRITVVVNSKDSHKLTVDIFDNSTTNKFIITKSKSKEFTCVFKGNGQSIVSEAWFSLTDVNGNPTNLATITSQSNNSCIVRGDNIGYVLMNVASADKTIINSKQIQVKSAI